MLIVVRVIDRGPEHAVGLLVAPDMQHFVECDQHVAEAVVDY